jgi:hypothetical protein
MSLPEISRRCVSCGAAVRAGARFCPQCGKAVPDDGARGVAGGAPPEEPAAREQDAGPPGGAAPPTKDVYAAASEGEPQTGRAADVSIRGPEPPSREAKSLRPGGDGARGSIPDTGELRAAAGAGDAARQGESARQVDAGGAGVQYASAALPTQGETAEGAAAEERRGRVARVREEARTRVESTRARVERVRDDALVALEEAPDDSGMRFVFVAVFLFALFLLFLLLSVTVLR